MTLRRLTCSILPGLSLLLAGCDLGTYEARRVAASGNLSQQAKTSNALGAAIVVAELSGTGAVSANLTISLPKAVGGANKSVAPGMPGAMPGVAFLYEADASGNGPLVLTGAVPLAKGNADQVAAQVEAAIKQFAAGAQLQNGAGPLPGSKRITATGLQSFGAPGALANADGRTEALIVPTPSHVAIVIYRCTTAAAADFPEQIQLSISSAKLAGT